ncbi:MAG: HEAT repeat domain-containing protein [Elusimicrobiota bacterium]|nr:HEAT repeat domain-containing protein [Elusimicrobiota bacterium]
MNKKILTMVFVLLLLPAALCAQTEEIMDRATRKYLRGDYVSAIEDFERILDEEENEKARRLLYNSIVAEGRRLYEGEQYRKAKEYLLRAQNLNSGDSEVESMLEKVNSALGTAPEKPGPEPAEIEELKSAVNRQRSETARLQSTVNSLVRQRSNLRNEVEKRNQELAAARSEIEKLESDVEETGSRFSLLGILAGGIVLIGGFILFMVLRKVYQASAGSYMQLEDLEEKIAARLQEADAESEELEERVARSINKMIDGQKDVVKNMALSAGSQAKNDIEEIKDKLDDQFTRQQEKLLELLTMQAGALSSEKTEKIEVDEEDGKKRVITDVNPHVRARADGVELIPKTISDPSVAEKMIKPYLTDPNNRVRANACVAAHQYNPELAVKTLEKMAESSDKWMRLSAAWAVGEISTPEVTYILRKLIDDIDERVKDRAIKSFENMTEVKADVGAEIRKMIDESREGQ